MEWDVFISHASEDKLGFVENLAKELVIQGLKVWYDDFILQPGDSLRQSIDQGLSLSLCGVVVLSNHFFRKRWPQIELDGLVSLARSHSLGKRIIPVWYGVSYSRVASYSPTVADLVALDASKGLKSTVAKIVEVVQRERSSAANLKKADNSSIAAIDNDRMAALKRRAELQKICHLAVKMHEQALLGIPKEYRSDISLEYAPFASDNMDKWQEAAQIGISDGQYLFGMCLDNVGETNEARKWLERASKEGHLSAMRELGEILLDSENYQEGLHLLLKAGDEGDANAYYNLARRYEDGDGVPKSQKKAHEFDKKAAALGHYDSKLFLKTEQIIKRKKG